MRDPAVDPGQADEAEALMEELRYMHLHAENYATDQGVSFKQARDYADWYMNEFGGDGIGKAPSHRGAFWSFLRTQQETGNTF